MQAITIDTNNANQRFDKFLLKYLNKAPKSFIYKMLRKKNIKLNGKKAEGNEMLKTGDEVALFLADDTILSFQEETKIAKQNKTPDIIYEDENLILVNKPVGMLVQGSENSTENLNDIILYYLKGKNQLAHGFKPGIANRLDRNTGGIVAMAKNLPAAQALSDAIHNDNVDKQYITVVKGEIYKQGEIVGYHTKTNDNLVTITDKYRPSATQVKTIYKPLHINNGYTVMCVKLVTGKSHQIRESFKMINHPIIGDPKYGNAEVNKFFKTKFGLNYQFLYAVKFTLLNQCGILEYLNNKTFECGIDKKATDVLRFLGYKAF